MTSQFWNITQCRLVVNYRRFRTTDRSDLQGFSIEVYHGYSLWIIFKHATALINTSDLIFVNGLHEIWEGVDYWLAARLLASPRLSLCSRKVIFFFSWFLSLTISRSFTSSLYKQCTQYADYATNCRPVWVPVSMEVQILLFTAAFRPSLRTTQHPTR